MSIFAIVHKHLHHDRTRGLAPKLDSSIYCHFLVVFNHNSQVCFQWNDCIRQISHPMSKAPLPILYPLITDRKRYKPSEKIVEVSFQNFQEFLSNLQIIQFPEPLFKLLEELEISHLFFGFASFCMESQKQLYHNPLTHLPSTNPHN